MNTSSLLGDELELGFARDQRLRLALGEEVLERPAVAIVAPALRLLGAVSTVNDRHLAIKALDAAIRRRCPGAGLLHHSDQGSTYATEDYRTILENHGITCSMSRPSCPDLLSD